MGSDVEGRVKRIMAKVFNLPVDQIGPELAMGKLAAWDSLNHINLILALEQEFKTRFPDANVVNMSDYTAVLKSVSEIKCDG